MPTTYVSNYTALLQGNSWTNDSAPTVLTYSFSNVSQSFSGLPRYIRDFLGDFEAFTSNQEALTRIALDAWAAVSGLTFIEVGAGDGDLEFGNFELDQSTSAFGFFPTRSDGSITYDELEYGGDVVVNTSIMHSMSLWVVLHEIGHALGLQHPHDADVRLNSAYDNATYTVMSYNATNATRLGLFDIEAIQSLYGSNTFSPSATGGILSFSVDANALQMTQTWGAAGSEILGSSLRDHINGGAGDDSIGGFAGNDHLNGGAGDDSLAGGAGDDSLFGGDGNDILEGGDGVDTLFGGAGNDFFYGFDPDGFTNDWVSYEGVQGDLQITLSSENVDLGTEEGFATGEGIGNDVFESIQNIIAGRGGDQIEGSYYSNNVMGSFGNDTIDGLGGYDTLDGGAGNDSILGGEGNDSVTGAAGFDTLMGGDDRDTLIGGAHADSLFGGNDNDSLDGGDGFDQLYGDNGDDTLLAGASPDRVYGGEGNDLIRGGRNIGITVDGLWGDAGNDTIYGEAGYDLLDGGAGNDLLDGGHQADNLLGGTGSDTMLGGLGLDRLFGGEDDDLGYGGAGTDGLFGERGNDTLYGEDGNDRFFGGQGDDLIFGGADDDTVYAGAGNDTINGGAGNDLLQGNFNADTFVFEDGHGIDTISDFDASNPREQIDLSGVGEIDNLFDLFHNHMEQVGADVLIITENDNQILLQNVDIGDLGRDNFIF